MKRKCLEHSECAVARALDAIGDWWSLLILREAFAGKRRFSEFQKSLGVARNILTTRLKKLVAHGVFEQVPASDGSAFHEYVLTERGRDFRTVLVALLAFGDRHFAIGGGGGAHVVDATTGATAEPMLVDRRSGKELVEPHFRIVRGRRGAPAAAPGREGIGLLAPPPLPRRPRA